MFAPGSRYARLETASLTTVDGRTIAYVRRRFLPRPETLPLLYETEVGEGERLDLLTARTLGDPLQSWRVADANEAMNPADLTERAGRTLRIPVPQS